MSNSCSKVEDIREWSNLSGCLRMRLCFTRVVAMAPSDYGTWAQGQWSKPTEKRKEKDVEAVTPTNWQMNFLITQILSQLWCQAVSMARLRMAHRCCQLVETVTSARWTAWPGTTIWSTRRNSQWRALAWIQRTTSFGMERQAPLSIASSFQI